MDIKEIAAGLGSSDALKEAAGKVGIDPAQAQNVVQGVLEHVTGGGGIEGLVASIAAKLGIDPGLIEKFLPHVMPLLQGHSENAAEGMQGMLGGLMGSVGGLLGAAAQGGAAEQGSAAGGALDMIKGLFGKKE